MGYTQAPKHTHTDKSIHVSTFTISHISISMSYFTIVHKNIVTDYMYVATTDTKNDMYKTVTLPFFCIMPSLFTEGKEADNSPEN